MGIKTYVVNSQILNDTWIVKSRSLKGAIIEVLAHLKPTLEILENEIEGNMDLDLKVSELQDTVTSIHTL